VHTGFWWGKLSEGGHLEDPGIDGRIILQCFFSGSGIGDWTGFFWLKIRTGCEHLGKR